MQSMMMFVGIDIFDYSCFKYSLKYLAIFSFIINPRNFFTLRHGKCENTLGSFRCLCDDGYSVKSLSSAQFGDRENIEEGRTANF